MNLNENTAEAFERPPAKVLKSDISGMLDIVLIGLSHKTAPVEVRECLAFNRDEVVEAVGAMRNDPAIKEVLLFSTCNRVEVLMSAEHGERAAAAATAIISDFKGVPTEEFEDSMYCYTGNDAVRHLFRVASSLDSMMVGEPQILGQIKDAFHLTSSRKASGPVLNRLLHRTFNIAKRVRTETGIGDSAVSISYAAVELAKKIFGELKGRQVLLVGAGEMAELAVEHLIRSKADDILVVNRTFERGLDLARRFNGQAIKFEELSDALKTADIIISSTGSPGYVIDREMVRSVIRSRRNRSIFFIDIAVPRDIDPAINKLANSYVYDIDDLKEVIDENLESRNREAVKAERMIDEAVINFRKWMEGLHVVPTIVAVKDKFNEIARCELEKTLQSMESLSGDDEMALKRMTEALVSRMLHDPIQFLKKGGHGRDESTYLSYARNLFNIDD